MIRLVVAVSLVLASGCTLSVISGFEDGGTSSGSGGSTGAGSLTNGGTTGHLATTGSGSASGGGSQSLGSTGQGSGSSGGSSGSSGGSTTGGPCVGFGSNCTSDAQCCDGACNGTCGQAFGQSCLGDPDCTSRNCVNGQCACSQSQGSQFGACASDQDCCGGLDCQHFYFGFEVGLCCIATGSACPAGNECCNQNCVDGQCQCLPTGSDCNNSLDDCCSGICTNVAAPTGVDVVCQSPPGGQCTLPTDCTTRFCDGGFCAGCGLAEAPCSSPAGCCTGLACASSLSVIGGFNGPIVDGGTTCCAQSGTSCAAIDGGATGCCGTCNNGTCACVTATYECDSDQSCCAGGACMRRASLGNGPLACCQLNGQFCLADDECCTGNCGQNQKCTCIADGGACGGSSSVEGPAACCSGQCAISGFCN